MKIDDRILRGLPEIIAIRRDLHAHPELAYQEQRTAQRVAELLEGWGIEVARGIGGTGVVGTVRGRTHDGAHGRAGDGAHAIGLRADMDALPIQEANRFAHRSQADGRMHACGHDGHTAMLLAAARHLSEQRDFDGVVHLIFQPAEEGGAGAQAMIDDGLFERFDCAAVFGMHNWPGTPAGHFGVHAGPTMASSNQFEITIEGRGSHAALPHQAVDPVIVATHLVQALQTIVSRNIRPLESAVVSVTQIHAGDAYNVIPQQAVLRGTVRTFTTEPLDLIEQRMGEIVRTLPQAFGASAELRFQRNYPPLINHERETAFCRAVARRVAGEDSVYEFEPTMGAEDFAFMLRARPGCYVMLGNGGGGHREHGHGLGPCDLHNPSYDFNDELIPIGASYWVELVRSWFGEHE